MLSASMKPFAVPGRWIALLLTTGLLTFAACGGGSPATTATPTIAAAPFEETRGPVEKLGSVPVPPGALLVNVRTGRHEAFDRAVFDFQGGLPGYRIEYVQPPIIEDPSGMPVQISGNAFLRVKFHVASANDPTTGQPTYSGPTEIFPNLPSLIELEAAGDFEGSLTWVLGLTEEVEFRVIELQDPFRVAIDVAHS